MKGIYLGAYKASHPGHDIIYQDINGKRDMGGDMLDVDLTKYDFIIATPPCNYWSRTNWRRDSSEYSQKTKHLLPCIIFKLIALGKPFIVENVRNDKMFRANGMFFFPCHIYKIGRHTYWTNILMSSDIDQICDNIKYTPPSKRQGGYNVHQVIEYWLSIVDN